MKSKIVLTKKEILVIFGCLLFLLINLAAVGSRGRAKAKEMACLSNLRQWGAFMSTYTEDNDGYFGYRRVFNWTWQYFDRYGRKWQGQDNPPWNDDRNLWFCPMATIPACPPDGRGSHMPEDPFTAWGYCWDKSGDVKDGAGSYGVNEWIHNTPDMDPYPGRKKEWHWRHANVAGADNIPLLLDAGYFCSWPLNGDSPPPTEDFYANIYGNSLVRFCINRHNGYVNGLFMNLGVRKIGLKELWRLKWHRSYDTEFASPLWESEAPWMADFRDYDQKPPPGRY